MFLVWSYSAIGLGFIMFRVWGRAAIRPSQRAAEGAENDEQEDEADDEEGGEEEEDDAMDPTVDAGSLPNDNNKQLIWVLLVNSTEP